MNITIMKLIIIIVIIIIMIIIIIVIIVMIIIMIMLGIFIRPKFITKSSDKPQSIAVYYRRMSLFRLNN